MNDSNEKRLYQNSQNQITSWQENQPISESSAQQHQCPNCGWGVSDTADICENCGEWLLKGQCNFCYAKVEEGQKFCSECGNPPEGIICFQCGQLSHFDFCPQCSIALTEQADETLELISHSVEIQNLIQISEDGNPDTSEQVDQAAIEMEKLKNYMSRLSPQNTEKPKPEKKTSFELKSNADVNVEENLKAVQQSGKNIKEAEQKVLLQQQKEIQAARLLEETRSKTFSSNQEARKFFGALKMVLATTVQKQIKAGWKCNAYNAVHNAPQECADPAAGGIWLYTTITEEGFEEIEI